jgi:hypothetical protein
MEELVRRAVRLGIIAALIIFAYNALFNPGARALYEAGLDHEKIEDYKKAYCCFNEIIRKHPITLWAWKARDRLAENKVYRDLAIGIDGKEKPKFGDEFWNRRKVLRRKAERAYPDY